MSITFSLIVPTELLLMLLSESNLFQVIIDRIENRVKLTGTIRIEPNLRLHPSDFERQKSMPSHSEEVFQDVFLKMSSLIGYALLAAE